MQEGLKGICPLCGVMQGRDWTSQPTDPENVRRQIRNLEQRIEAIEDSLESPQQVIQRRPRMCPWCQAALSDVGETATKDDLIERIQRRIDDVRPLAGG